MYRGIFIELKIMGYDNIKKISIADSIHDFGYDLIENFVYNHDRGRFNEYNNNMEENLLRDITNFNRDYNNLDFTTLRYRIGSIQDINGKISFAINVKDINNPETLNFIALIVGSADNNTRKLLTADVNLIPEKVLCSINQGLDSNIIQYSLTNSTIYDRGYNINATNCVRLFDTTAKISKEEGNLFGLEYIETGIDNELLKYKYTQPSNISNDIITINKSEFIASQSIEAGKFLTLFKLIIEHLNKRNKRTRTTGGGGKRGRSLDDSPMSIIELLRHLENTYHIDFKKIYNISGDLDSDESIKRADEIIKGGDHSMMIDILLDFKRAGDQLQAKTAKNLNSVFISNDRLAIAYAYELGVSSIKTSTTIDNETRGKKLSFYNFEKSKIESVFDNVDYYKRTHKNLVDNLASYCGILQQFKDKLNSFDHVININTLITNLNKYEEMLTNLFQNITIEPVYARDLHNQNVSDQVHLQTKYLFKHCTYVCKIIHILLVDYQVIPNILNEIQRLNETFNNIVNIQPVNDGVLQRLKIEINNVLENSYYKNASFIDESLFKSKPEKLNNFHNYIINVLHKIQESDITNDFSNFDRLLNHYYSIFIPDTLTPLSNKTLNIFIDMLFKWKQYSGPSRRKITVLIIDRTNRNSQNATIPFVRDSEFNSIGRDIIKLISKLEDYITPELIYTYNVSPLHIIVSTGGKSITRTSVRKSKRMTLNSFKKMSKTAYSKSKQRDKKSEYNNPSVSTHRDLLKNAMYNQRFFSEEKLDKFYKILFLFIAEHYFDERGFFISFQDSSYSPMSTISEDSIASSKSSTRTRKTTPKTNASMTSTKSSTTPKTDASMTSTKSSTTPKTDASMTSTKSSTTPKTNASMTSTKSSTTPKTNAKSNSFGGTKTKLSKNTTNNAKKPRARKTPVINKQSLDIGFFQYLSNMISNVFGTTNNNSKK